jgi:hypothetical protein
MKEISRVKRKRKKTVFCANERTMDSLRKLILCFALHYCLVAAFTATPTIRVGVIYPLVRFAEFPNTFLDQLNKDTYYDFSASWINNTDLTAAGFYKNIKAISFLFPHKAK